MRWAQRSLVYSATEVFPGAFASAFSCSAAFAALLPLGSARFAPPVARAVFSISITPIVMLATNEPSSPSNIAWVVARAAAAGISVGLCTSALAGAASAAGSLIDHALAGGLSEDAGEQQGPFTLLLPLLFAFSLCASGAVTTLIFLLCSIAQGHPAHIVGVIEVGGTVWKWAAVVAMPPIAAHTLATIAAGVFARLNPRVNGMLLAPAFSSPLVITTLLMGIAATFRWTQRLVELTAHGARP